MVILLCLKYNILWSVYNYYNTHLLSSVLFWTLINCHQISYCTALYWTLLHCTSLYFTALYCTSLYFIVPLCTKLHCMTQQLTALQVSRQTFSSVNCDNQVSSVPPQGPGHQLWPPPPHSQTFWMSQMLHQHDFTWKRINAKKIIYFVKICNCEKSP